MLSSNVVIFVSPLFIWQLQCGNRFPPGLVAIKLIAQQNLCIRGFTGAAPPRCAGAPLTGSAPSKHPVSPRTAHFAAVLGRGLRGFNMLSCSESQTSKPTQRGSCCCVPGCSLPSGTNLLSQIRTFRFPTEPVGRSAWIAAVRRDNWAPTKAHRFVVPTSFKANILCLFHQTNRHSL